MSDVLMMHGVTGINFVANCGEQVLRVNIKRKPPQSDEYCPFEELQIFLFFKNAADFDKAVKECAPPPTECPKGQVATVDDTPETDP